MGVGAAGLSTAVCCEQPGDARANTSAPTSNDVLNGGFNLQDFKFRFSAGEVDQHFLVDLVAKQTLRDGGVHRYFSGGWVGFFGTNQCVLVIVVCTDLLDRHFHADDDLALGQVQIVDDLCV